jgi:hypothetical protein
MDEWMRCTTNKNNTPESVEYQVTVAQSIAQTQALFSLNKSREQA